MSYEEDPYEREDREIREAFAKKDKEIARLKKLCVAAADALESIPIVLHPPHRDLVAQLRKAAK